MASRNHYIVARADGYTIGELWLSPHLFGSHNGDASGLKEPIRPRIGLHKAEKVVKRFHRGHRQSRQPKLRCELGRRTHSLSHPAPYRVYLLHNEVPGPVTASA